MKSELINMAWAGNKEKIWVPNRNRTHDLPNTEHHDLYPLSYENSWRARSCNWVHGWQASCILLGSALSRSLLMILKCLKMCSCSQALYIFCMECWANKEFLSLSCVLRSLILGSLCLTDINFVTVFTIIDHSCW